MDRRQFIKSTVFSAVALTLPGCSTGSSEISKIGKGDKSKPNFLFILADDFGWSQLGCYGSQYYETPKIDKLAEEGISCEIIDLRTVRPMDQEAILKSVKKTNRLVVLEEAWPFGNVATEITYLVQQHAFDYLDAPVVKLNTADTPAPYSPVLLEEWLPNSEDVIRAVKKVLYK